jgi:hypothetical protein
MLKNGIKYTFRKSRSLHGSVTAETACVLYVLFLFMVFPLLDLGAIGLRTFFLWFACNQSAMAGSKGTKWSTGNVAGTTDYAKSIQTQATSAATSVAGMFSGIKISSGYPKFTVILRAIAHSDTSVNQASATTISYINGAGLPLTAPMDTSQYIPILRVQILGTVQPFIPIPFFVAIPGLTAPFTLSIVSDQQIEDAQALSS